MDVERGEGFCFATVGMGERTQGEGTTWESYLLSEWTHIL